VGQEVVISCIDGDPDQPLVTGCVYNGTHATPVTLPANQTQTVIRTKSSKQGTAGNEIRLEDKKDSEEFYLHAQKDMKIEIENDLSTTLTAGAETHTIEKGDRTVAVKTGKETHSVKGVRALTITGNETHTNEADFTHEVTGNYTLKVTGDLLFDVTGSISFKSAKDVAVKAGTTVDNEAGTALTNKAGTALTNKAGTTLDNKGLMINSKASATQTVDGGGMLTVKGGLVKIN
jgi:type VI secretion system secreted protein VgrG